MYYLVKVKYDRTGENKPVTEQYVFDTDSFASADYATRKAIQPFATNDVQILAITRMNIAEVIGDAFGLESEAQAIAAQIMGKREISNAPDTWFKVKAAFITLDEKTQKEKRQSFAYLVHANNLDGAHNLADMELRKGMADYTIESVTETKIMEVYTVDAKTAQD